VEEVFRAFDTGMLSAGAGWSRPFRPFYLSMVFAEQGGAGLQAFSPGMVFADQGGAGLKGLLHPGIAAACWCWKAL